MIISPGLHRTSLMKRVMDTRDYWEQRLKSFCNLEGVGCIGLGAFFNSYVYRAKVRTLERVNRKFKIILRRKDMLDVGSGIGFRINYYLSNAARMVYGVDISSVAIKYLNEKYKGHDNVKLFEGDFSHLNLGKNFDVVNTFDVTYHVVDDELFTKFVENLCRHLKDGEFLFITDTFKQDYEDEITHVKFRSLDIYRKILEEVGVEIISLVPMYSILNRPYTAKCRLDELLTLFYSLSTQLYKRVRPSVKLAYYIDSCLTRFKVFEISTKLLVGKKGS